MRMSELAAEVDLPVATVKYYLREGLLPPGERTAPNPARYGSPHVRRLLLVRALREVAGLAIDDIRAVLDAADAAGDRHELLGAAHRAVVAGPSDAADDPEVRAQAERLRSVLVGHGWLVRPDARALLRLGETAVALQRLGRPLTAGTLLRYARVVDQLAAGEIATIGDAGPTAASADDLLVQVVVGTVVYEQVLASLRHLAQEHHSREHPSREGRARRR